MAQYVRILSEGVDIYILILIQMCNYLEFAASMQYPSTLHWMRNSYHRNSIDVQNKNDNVWHSLALIMHLCDILGLLAD